MVENSIHENRAFAYIRTSMKAGQAAVDNQYCAIREYCEKHNVKLDSVYTVAGTPEFASEFLDLIMEEMQKNSCDTLIIASTSRLGRNPAQVRKDIDKLTNHGIHICSVQDDLIETPESISEAVFDDEEDQDDSFSLSM